MGFVVVVVFNTVDSRTSASQLRVPNEELKVVESLNMYWVPLSIGFVGL